MMFSRKTIGLEIATDRVRMALVGGSRSKPVVDSVQEGVFPADTVRVSLRELNVLQQSSFVATVRETSLKLLAKTSRTAVSLPDASGRVVLLDLDTRFKSREEAVDIIRWKLKKNFPFDINDAHFDFQVLQERGSGEISALVSIVCRQVIQQYEELLVEAGLEPNQIDFTSFRLFELFAYKLALGENYLFVTHMAGVLSIMLFNQGILTFYRTKELAGRGFSVNRVYREISSSLLVCQDKNLGFSGGKVYCFTDNAHAEEFRSIMADATEQEPILLDVAKVVGLSPSCNIDAATLFKMSAAFGAAVRNL
ncbi:pilus assembly protein PilM [Geobacter pelophilus]|uniref:Pilus assembly protein PilM n=1 Tax=Geoanaerobacter pelophilus TaxID=60036 RepID=A0AAW4KZU0_9BACT|nr:pilus assembly protein PilM [Geoanaerobacter pelophilus]MBT0662787.1 pilus assembly protein PilM [Geoanaerobacter pelophilus]